MADSRSRLDVPRVEHRTSLLPRLDPDAFGQWTEKVARYFGTGRYLAIQTVLVIAWIVFNVAAISLRFDKYPFILLNLMFSTQAAYAAPLILLAQNRQDDRDRVQGEADRDEARQSKADLEYLAREIAAIRMALGEVATRDFLRAELTRAELSRAEAVRDTRDRDEEADAAPAAPDRRGETG
jgi:uncharacterized membrane protein